MKTDKISKFSVISNVSLAFLVFLLALLAGCAKQPSPKQVSSDKQAPRVFELPQHDINNAPISFNLLRDKQSRNVGFVIAGHAEKSICQIASMEMAEKLKEMGAGEETYSSFGVGYSLRVPEDSSGTGKWSTKYHNLLDRMQSKFSALAKQYPEQVKSQIIDYFTTVHFLTTT